MKRDPVTLATPLWEWNGEILLCGSQELIPSFLASFSVILSRVANMKTPKPRLPSHEDQRVDPSETVRSFWCSHTGLQCFGSLLLVLPACSPPPLPCLCAECVSPVGGRRARAHRGADRTWARWGYARGVGCLIVPVGSSRLITSYAYINLSFSVALPLCRGTRWLNGESA
jgi:hypothetical protein